MRTYVGCKIVQAEPMDESQFLKSKGQANHGTRPGYRVVYPDGYVSWSPAEVFENAYRLMTLAESRLYKIERG